MYESDPVPFSLTQKEYRNGTRDYVLLANGQMGLLDEKYNANKKFFEVGICRNLYNAS